MAKLLYLLAVCLCVHQYQPTATNPLLRYFGLPPPGYLAAPYYPHLASYPAPLAYSGYPWVPPPPPPPYYLGYHHRPITGSLPPGGNGSPPFVGSNYAQLIASMEQGTIVPDNEQPEGTVDEDDMPVQQGEFVEQESAGGFKLSEKIGKGENGESIAIGQVEQNALLNEKLQPVRFMYTLSYPAPVHHAMPAMPAMPFAPGGQTASPAGNAQQRNEDTRSLLWYFPKSEDVCPDCFVVVQCNEQFLTNSGLLQPGGCFVLPVDNSISAQHEAEQE